VLVVGDAMLDRYWHGAVERISPEAPVPVVKVTREEERIGAAANVAYNVSTLGAQASFLGVVGDDEPGHKLEKRCCQDTGIRTTSSAIPACAPPSSCASSAASSSCCAWTSRTSRTTRCWPADRSLRELCARSRRVLFSDYGKGGLAHIPAMIAGARAGKVVLVDPKGSDYSATAAPPSSRPTAPNCRTWWAAGAARTTCAPRRRTCAPRSTWARCWSRAARKA
jgi:bifunctional ADP-heptose synthase (sugar kinase/adenylyltransferase)